MTRPIPSRSLRRLLPVCLSLLLLADAGCHRPETGAGGTSAAAGDPALKGTIRISGAWALYPMMITWGEEFSKLHPGVRVDVSAGGAGKGMADALGGLVDLGMVSREIRPEETALGACAVPVVKDAVFPTINAAALEKHPSILSTGVSRDVLITLWISGRQLSWGEVCGTDETGTVTVYTRSDACGAAETWARYLGASQEDLKSTAVYGDPGLADAVKQDPNGIGYNNLNFAYDIHSGFPVAGLAILPIDLDDNGILDEAERLATKADAIGAINSGSYPSPPARDLYLVARDSFTGVTRAFVEWILGDGQDHVDRVGYIALAPEKLQQARDRLAGKR